jgi:two-component system KDP operon response regulator KdpE
MGDRLLVVDDDPGVLHVLRVRLRAAGYEVLTATDGAAGLRAAKTQHPAGVVLDLRMPVMDGLTVLSKLREDQSTRSIPVVVLSANVVERAKRKALDLGARFFLEKPYDPRKLVEAIQTALLGPAPLTAA